MVACSFCKKYIGEIRRTIEKRIKEHQTEVNNEKSAYKITALSQHLRESGNISNWQEVEILAKKNFVKQKFKDSVAIT